MSVLDLRDPKHIRAEERLGSEPIIWLTTVSANGQPQTSPVWFYWDGETFLMYSRPAARKLQNIAANPRVSLHLEGDGVGGDNVILEGTGTIRPDGPSADRVPDYIEKYRHRIEQYGWTPQSFAADYSQVIRVTPTRIRVW